MSDIIIEGKNLSDINQSNFQTVGVRSALYFDTSYYANESLSVDEAFDLQTEILSKLRDTLW